MQAEDGHEGRHQVQRSGGQEDGVPLSPVKEARQGADHGVEAVGRREVEEPVRPGAGDALAYQQKDHGAHGRRQQEQEPGRPAAETAAEGGILPAPALAQGQLSPEEPQGQVVGGGDAPPEGAGGQSRPATDQGIEQVPGGAPPEPPLRPAGRGGPAPPEAGNALGETGAGAQDSVISRARVRMSWAQRRLPWESRRQ